MRRLNIEQSAEQTGIRPCVIEQIAEIARLCSIERVVLFGSRARGNYSRASDIDLAVKGGDVVRFHVAVEEDTDTLLTFDVVDEDQPISESLQESIQKEGIILYEKV